uniref:Uncharacterized protein n=1 Tax=Glossina austeni TaxID=7395 RepID=A0A1A9VMN2_GLOAU
MHMDKPKKQVYLLDENNNSTTYLLVSFLILLQIFTVDFRRLQNKSSNSFYITRVGLNKFTWEKENYILKFANFESNNFGILLRLTVPLNFLIIRVLRVDLENILTLPKLYLIGIVEGGLERSHFQTVVQIDATNIQNVILMNSFKALY